MRLTSNESEDTMTKALGRITSIPVKKTVILGMVSFIALSGCAVNRVRYESVPVKVATSQGQVLCQLYTVNSVMWDEAIVVPEGMLITTGNSICHNEGLRLRQISLQG